MECSRLFDLCQAFAYIESSKKSDIFLKKDLGSFMRAKHILSYLLSDFRARQNGPMYSKVIMDSLGSSRYCMSSSLAPFY